MLKGLIACGAVIVVLLAGLGWQSWQLGLERKAVGKLEAEAKVCREATVANLTNLKVLESELAECIGEATVVESELAADAARRAHQVDTLEQRVASLQAALRRDSADDDCAGKPVPGDSADRLRDAADRAHRAGHQDSAPVGSDSG